MIDVTMRRNRTKKYLSPIFLIEKDISRWYRRVYKKGVFIFPEKDNTILLVIDKTINPENIRKLTNAFQDNNWTINIIEKKKEMLIYVTLPKTYNKAWKAFINGEYSKMFTEEQLKEIFPTQSKTEIFLILTKDDRAIKNLSNLLDQEFSTELTYEEMKEFKEYDIPSKAFEEVYDYEGDTNKNLKTYLDELRSSK